MNTKKPNRVAEGRLLEAEVNLSNTLRYLSELQHDALHGGRYDAEQFERAVVAYRKAEAKLLDARIAFAESQLEQLMEDEASTKGTVDAPWPDPISPCKASPRLRWMRWMVEQGKVTDQR